MTYIVHPITQSLQAWRYTSDCDWPSWVCKCCHVVDGELVHDRQSGRQVLYPGEWLVRDLDGGINFYTNDEFRKSFRQSRPEIAERP